jgi:hypothetical protein
MPTPSVRSPIDDLTYDVLTLLQNKAKALEAYDKYLEDAAEDDEIHDLLVRLRRQDEEHVRLLRDALVRCLEEEDLEEEYEEDDEEYEDEDLEEVEEDDTDIESRSAAEDGDAAEAGSSVQGPAGRRGESGQRRN